MVLLFSPSKEEASVAGVGEKGKSSRKYSKRARKGLALKVTDYLKDLVFYFKKEENPWGNCKQSRYLHP